MSKSYLISPLDTQHVILPTSLVGLVEELAEHNHAQWAKQRRGSQGIY